jgi:hypothetical protein
VLFARTEYGLASKSMRTTSMILLPCLMAAAAFFLWTHLFCRQRAVEAPDDDVPDIPAVHGDRVYGLFPPCESNRYRAEFTSGSRAIVLGWPSKGGIYSLDCTGVELDFLGLDRFHNTKGPSESDPDARSNEEAHCNWSMWHLNHCRSERTDSICSSAPARCYVVAE